MSAAYAHVLGDLIQSVGVVCAGLIIWWQPTWLIVDPICTFIFCFLVLRSTKPLSKQVSNILFEGVPEHIEYEEVKTKLLAIPGVMRLHDLHIWSLSSTSVAMSCHLQIDTRKQGHQKAIEWANEVCSNLGIGHITVQIEEDFNGDGSDADCPTHNESHMCL